MLKKHKLQLSKVISAKPRYLAFKSGCPESSRWTIKKDHSSIMAEIILLNFFNPAKRKATGICLKNHVSQLLSHFLTIYHFELKGGRLIRSAVKNAQFFLFPLSHRYIRLCPNLHVAGDPPPSNLCNRITLYRSFHREVRLGGWGLRGRRPRH